MAITNKIERAVKRLMVIGKVCWLWDNESVETEIGWNGDLTTPNTTKTLRAAIGVQNNETATPSVATDTFEIPSGLVPNWSGAISADISGIYVEVSNYTGGAPGTNSHFMVGGTPPGDNFNRATLQVSSPSATYALNVGSSNELQNFNYTQTIAVDEGATLTLKLDSVDGLAIRSPNGYQAIELALSYFDVNQSGPMCSLGEDYHDKDIAAFQVIATRGEEMPPHSGNYLVHVRVLCNAQGDDGTAGLTTVQTRMDQLRAALDTDDLPARITSIAGGGLTVLPGSVWGRGLTEGVEGRKFSSGWEFTCVACEADL